MRNKLFECQRKISRTLVPILFMSLVTMPSLVASAVEILDDFEDGSFVDGTPGQWWGSLLFDDNVPATIDVENGALVLDSIADDAFIKADLLRIGSTDGPMLESGDSWSIRSQFRFLDERGEGELAHAGLGTTAFQSAFLTIEGELRVGQGFNVNSVETNFERILERDFVIQFDVEEDLLTGHVWPLDDPQDRVSVEFEDQSRQSRPLAFNRRTVAAYDYIQASSNPPLPFPAECLLGDFDCDGVVGLSDVEALSTAINGESNTEFDIDASGTVDVADLRHFIEVINGTWIGDANLDGEFNSGDFVDVFSSGKYETGEIAKWNEGDWNADQRFDSGDFVVAFNDGGYESGAREAVAAVPEPSSWALLAFALVGISRVRRIARDG